MLVDVYAVLEAFDVRSHPIGHAIKKLLCFDLDVRRDKVSKTKEMEDIFAALWRAKQDLEEEEIPVTLGIQPSGFKATGEMAEILKGPAHTTTEEPDWQKNPWDKAKITPPEGSK